jgi:Flp pilus assembly pilin Flp
VRHARAGQLAPEGGERTVHVSKFLALLTRAHDDEGGQGLAEYALILGLIAVVAIVALLYLGGQVSDKLSVIGGTLQSVAP